MTYFWAYWHAFKCNTSDKYNMSLHHFLFMYLGDFLSRICLAAEYFWNCSNPGNFNEKLFFLRDSRENQ